MQMTQRYISWVISSEDWILLNLLWKQDKDETIINKKKKKDLIIPKRLGGGLGHIPICLFPFTPPINTPTATPPVSAKHGKFSFPVLNMEKQQLSPAAAGRCTESELELQGELEFSGCVG